MRPFLSIFLYILSIFTLPTAKDRSARQQQQHFMAQAVATAAELVVAAAGGFVHNRGRQTTIRTQAKLTFRIAVATTITTITALSIIQFQPFIHSSIHPSIHRHCCRFLFFLLVFKTNSSAPARSCVQMLGFTLRVLCRFFYLPVRWRHGPQKVAGHKKISVRQPFCFKFHILIVVLILLSIWQVYTIKKEKLTQLKTILTNLWHPRYVTDICKFLWEIPPVFVFFLYVQAAPHIASNQNPWNLWVAIWWRFLKEKREYKNTQKFKESLESSPISKENNNTVRKKQVKQEN